MTQPLSAPTNVPKPRIYLRNQFTINPNCQQQFLYGKENLIRNTLGYWHLVAAAGERPCLQDTAVPEPTVPMVQIWRLDDWQSLYQFIYSFSDTGWYMSLGNSLATEKQEFLVGVLHEKKEPVAPEWKTDTDPGYVYLYEEALPHHQMVHSYLRDIQWFGTVAGAVEKLADGSVRSLMPARWKRVWTGLQVTAAPSTISNLWRVHGTIDDIEKTIDKFSNGPVAERYKAMMGKLKTFSRQSLYPIFSERLAQRIVLHGDAGPIIATPQLFPRNR